MFLCLFFLTGSRNKSDFSVVCMFRDLSVDLLQMIPDNHLLLSKLCALYPGSAADIDRLHGRVSVRGAAARSGFVHRDERFLMIVVTVIVLFSFKCGLPSLEECRASAEAAVCEGDVFSAVKFHLLSSDPENALPIGIDHVKGTDRNDSSQNVYVYVNKGLPKHT